MITRLFNRVPPGLLTLILLLTASPCRAQDAPPPAPVPVTVGWQDGFVLQSVGGDFRLVFGAAVQMDGRFTFDDPSPVVDTFLLRKIRPTLNGRIARYFEFRLTPDFANGTAVIQDAYVDIRFFDALHVRTGKDKTPVGYESLLGDSYLLFPERSLASSLLPGRDVGVQIQGVAQHNRLSYAAGLFNGVPDATSSSPADSDTNNAKDFAGRIVVQPFRTRPATDLLSGFGFQVGGTTGRESSTLPSFKTSIGQTYFSYASGAVADGVRNRASAATFYYYRSLGAFAEYTRSTQPITRSSVRTDIANDGWEVTGSFVLTGEPTSERGVRPKANFDPSSGHWGAVQIIGRYTGLSVDQAAFAAGLGAATASRDARAVGVGVNWYLTPNIRYYTSVERTAFDGGPIPRPVEHSIIFRAQIAF